MDKQLTAFQHRVENKYQEYNELFLHLPFSGVPEAGRELPEFADFCKDGLQKGLSPDQIISEYFKDNSNDEAMSLMLLFLQFIERQIVLFDALEDCAFALINDCDLPTPKNDTDFRTRVVLTAHPTQFYAPAVLNIIEDLCAAIQAERIDDIKKILLQMGKTGFMNHKQPTPVDEAKTLIDYLQRIFYPTIQNIQGNAEHPKIELGFWPGGDRDGNPNVTAQVTLEVAALLKSHLFECYKKDLNTIQRRMTFANVQEPIRNIILQLENYKDYQSLLHDLLKIKTVVETQHDSLFIEVLEPLINAVRCFGFHFASLDIRQDSSMHEDYIDRYIPNYLTLSSTEKCSVIKDALTDETPKLDHENDVIAAIRTIPVIQKNNGHRGCHRYVISNTHGAHHILEILLLAKWAGIHEAFEVDIVPLFESIDDLESAEKIMAELYQNPTYKAHLKKRNDQQTIMLGFSDGTKDGGYITANWSIYQAKKRLSAIAKEHNIEVIFFDGRGGPPARGGGNTQRYYKAQEADIALHQIQLTIQGQTISTNFGTTTAAEFNLKQLYNAGLSTKRPTLSQDQVDCLKKLSKISAQKYNSLKHHPQFLDYLEQATPLNYYGQLNIASRPPRRGQTKKLSLDDLRAIPFVGAWSQMKQNVPGFYGVGTALQSIQDISQLKTLYLKCEFFATLIDNAAQSLKKTYFPLTAYLKNDPQFKELWNNLYEEAQRTQEMILAITGEKILLEHNPVIGHSIDLRNEIVLPLLVIQQYALIGLRQDSDNESLKKLLLKSLATNINAARNAA